MSTKRIIIDEVVELLAQRSKLTPEQVKAVLQAQAELAYSHADEGYPIPGIGKLIKVETQERKMVMRFGPKTGQEIAVPAKTSIKFRLSRLATEMALRPPKTMPDIFKPFDLSQFEFSSAATELSDQSKFIADLGPLKVARNGQAASIVVQRLPDLRLTSGRIIAGDPIILGSGEPFSRSAPPGLYPLILVIARLGNDQRVALAMIRFSDQHAVKWEPARPESRDDAELKPGEVFSYGVDSGTGGFWDLSVQQLLAEANQEENGLPDRVLAELKNTYKHTREWLHVDSPNGSVAYFSSGFGDGSYPSYFGLDAKGNLVSLVTDFKILGWGPVASQ